MTLFRVYISSDSDYPFIVNETSEKDLFRDVIEERQKVEAIESKDDLEEYLFDYLECKTSFITEMFFEKVEFEQMKEMIVNYRYEDEYIVTGQIKYDFVKKLCTSNVTKEEIIQLQEGVFGEEDVQANLMYYPIDLALTTIKDFQKQQKSKKDKSVLSSRKTSCRQQ